MTDVPNHASLSVTDLIATLVRDEDRAPRDLIDECPRRGDAMVECLQPLVAADPASADKLPLGEWWLRYHAAMICGLIASERAGALLIDLMRWMDDAEDDNLQDWLITAWPALYRNKPDTVLPALRALAGDRRHGWYIRHPAVESILAFAESRTAPLLEESLDWVASLVADENEDWDFRVGTASTLLDFPRERHRALIETIARRQVGTIVHFNLDDVRGAYDSPGFMRSDRHSDPWSFYSESAIAARQIRWAQEDAKEDRQSTASRISHSMVHTAPKIGRNDPCPCGSGKKYKKCCLGAEPFRSY